MAYQADPAPYDSAHARSAPSAEEPLRVDARPVDYLLERDLDRIARLAHILDSQFSIGGVKFGFDSLIGLIPGVGDVATAALALYPVMLAQRHGLGRWTILRMLGNIGIDAGVGTIPLAGDIFDVAFKANRKNLELFRKAVEKRYGKRPPGAGASTFR